MFYKSMYLEFWSIKDQMLFRFVTDINFRVVRQLLYTYQYFLTVHSLCKIQDWRCKYFIKFWIGAKLTFFVKRLLLPLAHAPVCAEPCDSYWKQLVHAPNRVEKIYIHWSTCEKYLSKHVLTQNPTQQLSYLTFPTVGKYICKRSGI